ncbi:hypothetical protein GM661_10075 [Iocasia frigidifontis]|uniref:Uncharacterized protein n=1 Tax=Iocasia fonsfrigidae TaxID=2682810 RepID=A0A8A7KAN6_9FIRM|nr:hypothetical protein [Iocasia fonsfrigidae]QTL98300.1 hypothetical protein GM661_10075 [Iocasia fonsfrigidae]
MFERLAGVILIGFVIKMMDDFLDQEIDILQGDWNLTSVLKKGILPYSLVIMIFALHLNFAESVSYFSASYLLGMSSTAADKLPSRLRGWQEGLILIVIAIYLTSLREVITSIILVLILQFVDDYLDYKKEIYIKKDNLINKLGHLNGLIIFIILFILVFNFCLLKMIYFSLASCIIYLSLWLLKKYQIGRSI